MAPVWHDTAHFISTQQRHTYNIPTNASIRVPTTMTSIEISTRIKLHRVNMPSEGKGEKGGTNVVGLLKEVVAKEPDPFSF